MRPNRVTQIKREPEDYARALLARFQIDRIKDVSEFAKELGLRVREVDSTSFDGALVRKPNELKGIVAVKRSIREPGRKIFTIAHEIAHFLLPGHGTSELYCTASDISSWRTVVARDQELSANRFAAEILLPLRQIYDIVNRQKATITLAKELSTEFNTSLTATVIKCVEATEEACAVVWSVDNEIRWSRKNSQFSFFINSGRLGVDSLAGQLFQNTTEKHLNDELPADSWLGNENLKGSTIWEDSIYLPYYNGVLSILTVNK